MMLLRTPISNLCTLLVDILLIIYINYINLDFRKRWCTLENGCLSYFDSEKVVDHQIIYSFVAVMLCQ